MPQLLVWLLLSIVLASGASAQSKLKLANGDQLTGRIIEETEDHVVVEHPVLGRLEVPRAELEPPKPPDDGAFGTGLLRGWERKVDVGLAGSEGNTDEVTLRTALQLRKEDERTRWTWKLRYLFGQTDNKTDEHEAHLEAAHDWLRPGSSWFVWTGGNIDWDKFEEWDARLAYGGGPGYQFVKNETWELLGRTGLQLRREVKGDHELEVEAIVGWETAWNVTEGQKFTFSNRAFFPLGELGEFRNLTSADYSIRLAGDSPLSLRFGVDNEYDSQSETENNDLKYFGSLVYDF